MTGPELADAFSRAHHEVVAFAQSHDLDQWVLPTPGDGRPLGVVLDHVGVGYANWMGWADLYLAGHPVTTTRADLDGDNALHAEAVAGKSREATIEDLHRLGHQVADRIRTLSSEDLAVTHPFAIAMGTPASLEQLVETLVRHTRSHLNTCRAALGEAAAAG